MKHIALLDCNNFFVSCERLFRPDLKTRPVLVLSSNDGCVVARSKEIKDMGIAMGVPYFQIKDKLKEVGAVVFSSHFALYRDVSRRVFEVVRSEYNTIEQYSIDECFISFESESPLEEMRKLKLRIEREVGIPVSVGVASSKTQAKYASSVAKKTDGLTWLTNEDFAKLTEGIKLGEIWGVGRGMSQRFAKDGLYSAAQFLAMPKPVITARYGLVGTRLHSELLGLMAYPIQAKRIAQKSCMSTRSFANETSDMAVLKEALSYHLHQVVADLVSMDLATTTVRVLIAPSRYGSYALHSGVGLAVLTSPSADIFSLQKVVDDLLIKVYKPGVPYKKAGVVVSGLVSASVKTESLFATEEDEIKTSSLTKTMLSINKLLGREVLSLGRLPHKKSAWDVKRNLLSPAYTTNWDDIKSVSASK